MTLNTLTNGSQNIEIPSLTINLQPETTYYNPNKTEYMFGMFSFSFKVYI